MSTKNPLTPAGIEPATFRFVAQHFNHCANAVPSYSLITSWNLTHLKRNVPYLNEGQKLNGIAVYVSRPEVFIMHATVFRSTNTVRIPVARWQPVTWFIQSYESFSASQIFVLSIYCAFFTNTLCCVVSFILGHESRQKVPSLGENIHNLNGSWLLAF